MTAGPGPTLPPEIITVLRRNAEATLVRHVVTVDGRCAYCSMTWLHTDTYYPCPPVRIALEFLRLTEPEDQRGVARTTASVWDPARTRTSPSDAQMPEPPAALS